MQAFRLNVFVSGEAATAALENNFLTIVFITANAHIFTPYQN